MSISVRIKLGQKIRRLRTARGLTQDRLGEITGIDYKYIQKIEGKNPPAVRIDTIEKIASKFRTTASAIRLTNLIDNDSLSEGEQLIIPTHLRG